MRKVFIYGGCTSRDAVDHYPDYGLELHSYIARQSLISAFQPAARGTIDTSVITGNFKRRMIAGDITSSLPRHLLDNAADIDLMVWDLMIERVGVQKVRAGGIVTRNGLTRKQTGDRSIFGGSYEFGTPDHLRVWSDAFQKMITVLDRAALRDRVVVNATPWAVVDTSGTRPEYDAGMEPEFFNAHVEEYWAVIEQAGIKVARVPQEAAIADPDHKWGPAYFHYVPSTYRAQLDAITALI